jgi:hypothetical protein
VRRVRSGRIAVAVLVAGGLATPALGAVSDAAAAPHASATVHERDLVAATQTLKSSAHGELRMTFSADDYEYAGDPSPESVTVVVSRKGDPETHSWTFAPKAGALTYNSHKGTGTYDAHSQMAPYVTAAIKLAAVGKKSVVTCGAGTITKQPVTINGRFTFATRAHAWGSVTTTHFTGHNVLMSYAGNVVCGGGGGPPVTACTNGFTFQAFGSKAGTTVFDGSKRTTGGLLMASRYTNLTKPKKATRRDSLNVIDPKMSFVTEPGGGVSVTIGPAGPLVTGSAKLATDQAGFASTFPCGDKGKTLNQDEWTTSYVNSKSPLVVHAQIEGSFTLADIPATASPLPAIFHDTVS